MSPYEAIDARRAAVALWTADPCEAHAAGVPIDDPHYYERLRAARRRYAPWMGEALGYGDASGVRVLDVGCGQGIDLAEFALRGALVSGVDLTPRHVDLARDHLQAIGRAGRVVRGDAESLPFDDASFDLVTSNGVLHHTADMPAALREIRRVLRPGGEARILVYNRNSLHYWLEQVLYKGLLAGRLRQTGSMEGVLSEGVERSSIGARTLVRVYSPRQMRRLLRASGFHGCETSVRHFKPTDTFLTSRWMRSWPQRSLDLIGRAAGWYVVARGSR